ncbi:MAG: thymidine phosphorylase family protein [Exilibacterium sp.]
MNPNTPYKNNAQKLKATRIGIDTQQELVIYIRADSPVCRSEGFVAQTRVRVSIEKRFVIAKLNVVSFDLLPPDTAGLCDSAWRKLGLQEGDTVKIEHPDFLASLSYVRSKIYNNVLSTEEIAHIVADIVAGRYSDVHLATFLTACAGDRLNRTEVAALTRAMVESGQVLKWNHHHPILDKHCVGGLPGNRTTPIVVSIIAAAGLIMPKTSSRSITSPAGTADTMEVLTPIDLSLEQMQTVVNAEGGCLAWGGNINLSPADDLMIRVERAINLDSEGQLIASVLSKKIAAGATHVLVDIPTGVTAKVRTEERARRLSEWFVAVGNELGIQVQTIITAGVEPIGNGIGPALEARDVLAVLKRESNAPTDLRERALLLAGTLLEMSGKCGSGTGEIAARAILDEGRAWEKFQTICLKQGGLRSIPEAPFKQPIGASATGTVTKIDNRQLAQVAKLAGAPQAKSAGVLMAKKIGDKVAANELLMTIHAETLGELKYAEHFYQRIGGVFSITA